MKILVTGGLGLIGHNVVSRLEKLGHFVIVTDTRTNYGIIPQLEVDYLMSERLKKISLLHCYPFFSSLHFFHYVFVASKIWAYIVI